MRKFKKMTPPANKNVCKMSPETPLKPQTPPLTPSPAPAPQQPILQEMSTTTVHTIVAGTYALQKKIGNGSFGDIYLGANIFNGEQVAIKLEVANGRHPQLPNEASIYDLLKGSVGIPHYRYHGVEGNYNILVLDLLGPSLEDLFNYCYRRFSLKTTLMLADQMILRMHLLHFNCLIHRDIKPENFLMGLGSDCHNVFLIDYGLAKRYCDPITHRHINFRDRYDLIGTARYASCNAHRGIEQSRRDDMESVGYLLIYFHRGSLPWQGVRSSSKKQKYEQIAEIKISTKIEDLCSKSPFEFQVYMNYCRELDFDEQPNYDYLRRIFQQLARSRKYLYDYAYDWLRSQKDNNNSNRQNDKKRDHGKIREQRQQGNKQQQKLPTGNRN